MIEERRDRLLRKCRINAELIKNRAYAPQENTERIRKIRTE